MENISYEDFKKLDMRFGEIKEATMISGSDKLVKCAVYFNEEIGTRIIVSGIKKYIDDIQSIVGKKVLYVINLEPRMIMGTLSQGMLMAYSSDDDSIFSFVVPENSAIGAGSKIK